MKKFLTLALGFMAICQMDAQVRYLNEVFTDVNVTTDVLYGQNVTVLPLLQGAPPAAQPLVCDIYEPAGDTETDRPLMIYIHTGNFLPQYLNGSAVGTKSDSVAVELCSRYAKMGYVVASIDYRLGWNPLAATQSERTYQLINAAYRGVQDARTAVRFFRKSEGRRRRSLRHRPHQNRLPRRRHWRLRELRGFDHQRLQRHHPRRQRSAHRQVLDWNSWCGGLHPDGD